MAAGMILSHPDRFRHLGTLAGELYEVVMRHSGEISVTEAVGALELVKSSVISEAVEADHGEG